MAFSRETRIRHHHGRGMAVLTFADMTWEEVRELPASRTAAVLPVGALEAHGPHLPLATDVIIAEAMAQAGAEQLSAMGWTVLLLPPLSFTVAGFASGFAGTVSVGQEAVAATVQGTVQSLHRHGLHPVAIANAHLDPAHLAALRRAAALLEEEGIAVVFPDLTRRAVAERLTDEFRTGACHAGRFESSIVMAARPDLVHEAERQALPPNPASLTTAIRGGHTTFEEAGGPLAYFGWPADATASEGRASIDVLGRILADAVLERAARADIGAA